MATLGYRTIDEMVGQTQRLAVDEMKMNYKSKGLDLSPLLLKVGVGFGIRAFVTITWQREFQYLD